MKSIEYLQKALEIQLKTLGSEHPEVANTYANIGLSYNSKNNCDEAIYFFQKALKSCRYTFGDYSKVNSLEQLRKILQNFTSILLDQYKHINNPSFLIQAHFYTLQALAALDYQQSTLTEESSKSFHLSQNYPIYEQAISVSLLKADVDHNDTLRQNTFTYAEKSKAALLQAQIKAADALAFAGIPDSLLEQEYNLRIDITWREKQRQSLLDQGLTETDTNVLRISGIVFDLKQQYETLKKRFETEYPDYYRLKYDLSTVSLPYVQDTLLQKDQALLEYFTGDSSLFLFVVRPDTFLVQEVKRDFPLEAWIDSLRFGLYGYYTTDKSQRTDSLREAALNSYILYSQLLQQKLIAPVAAWLPEKVILVPDGPLGYIPFDALLSAEPEDRNNFKSYPYLLQKHQFSYTYSATLLREMRDKKHRREPQYDFAAFAPFYNGDTTLLAGMYAYDDLMRKDLQPLAFSGPEVAAAAKLMKGETIAGPAATEERFTTTAGNYRILHLATHGRADNRVGDYAFLAFNEIKDSIENELLYVKDLYNLQLNADLVVLSACETGIGKLQRGEGIISLARAFAYAGAKSIVTSLWSVNDKSTSELMRFFYRELRRGKDKDEALRLARQRLIREATVRNSHPFFWAAFVPLGDMRGVK
jgi:CHAT domain-containing protein